METLPPEVRQSEQPADSFDSHYRSLDNDHLFPLVDAVLKQPARIVYELKQKQNIKVTLQLLGIVVFCLAAIGLMMGSFSGGAQLWAAPLKAVLGTGLSAAICLPSLYILLCLSGGTQSFPDAAKLLLLCLSLAGILFIGFMPVAWIFSQATDEPAFMGFLYLLIWGIGLSFGFRLLTTAFRHLNRKSSSILNLWFIIFTLVLLQMSTTLRPIIGTADAQNQGEKKFFLAHWVETISR